MTISLGEHIHASNLEVENINGVSRTSLQLLQGATSIYDSVARGELNTLSNTVNSKLPKPLGTVSGIDGYILSSNGSGTETFWIPPPGSGPAFRAIYDSALYPTGSIYTLQNAWPVSDLLSANLKNAGTTTDSSGNTTTNRKRGCFNVLYTGPPPTSTNANNVTFGGYDTTTGMFTAPYDGLYFFSASVLWHTGSFVAGYTTVMITKPGYPVPDNISHATAYLISQSGSNEAFDTNYTQTCDGVVKLIAGEAVGLYVRGQYNGGAPKIDLSMTSFCGYLIQRT